MSPAERAAREKAGMRKSGEIPEQPPLLYAQETNVHGESRSLGASPEKAEHSLQEERLPNA